MKDAQLSSQYFNESESSMRDITVVVEVNDDEYDPVVAAIVEMATSDGSFMSSGNLTDENGQVQFVVSCGDEERIYASIYLNGSSQGQFEFDEAECKVDLRFS
jgi:hypothetical protein